MIPENIKIDDDGNFEIQVTSVQGLTYLLFFTFEEIEEAYLLAKRKRENQNKPIKFGCHISSNSTCICVMEYISTGECPDMYCEHWRVVEVKK